MKFVSSSEKQTLALAEKIASQLRGGEIIGLVGQLGAGKTVFVKGLAKGLAIKKIITSPTFVLMKIYPVKLKKQPAIKNLVHLDVYRIKQIKDILAIGIAEYLGRADTACVIEWADKIKKILPKRTRFINFKTFNNKRFITLRNFHK